MMAGPEIGKLTVKIDVLAVYRLFFFIKFWFTEFNMSFMFYNIIIYTYK